MAFERYANKGPAQLALWAGSSASGEAFKSVGDSLGNRKLGWSGGASVGLIRGRFRKIAWAVALAVLFAKETEDIIAPWLSLMAQNLAAD